MQQNKKENLCEFSFTGLKIKEDRLNPIIEELFENSAGSYKYEISTYRLQYRSKEGIDNLFNLIEIHKNLFDPYEK